MRLPLILAAAATVAALGASAASAADLPSFADAPPPAPPPLAWSPWLVRVRALGVLPDPGARLSAAGGDVTRFQGCEQGQDHVASVLRSPGPARVVVAAGETLEAARARAPRGAACDIEGGCIPLSFAAAK